MDDTPRPVATNDDTIYTLSIDDVVTLYSAAGHPRTVRTVQRYCASGHINCIKEAATLGDRYFIEPQSVERHIAQIKELVAIDNHATHRDLSRPVATPVTQQNTQETTPQAVTTTDDMSQSVATTTPQSPPENSTPTMHDTSRPVATNGDIATQTIAHLKREVELLTDDKEFLRNQIQTKDETIASLLERDKETNFLVRGLQQMLTPLLGGSQSNVPHKHEQPPNQPV